MDITPELKAEIERRRNDPTDISYRILSDEEILNWIQKEQAFPEPKPDTPGNPRPHSDLIQEQEQFYQEIWGMETDFSKIPIPEKQSGFDWLLIMQAGIKTSQIIQKMNEKFTVWTYKDDLSFFDKTESQRTTKTTYAIWLRNRIEADEEHQNKSANQIKKEGINAITLEERLMLELWYWWKKKKHLDIKNWTLCAGSRSSDGSVPYVYWYSGYRRVGVDWCDSGRADGSLRARAAIS